MENTLLKAPGQNYLLNFEDLIDPRIREQKIYKECFDTLFENGTKPDDSEIQLHIREICIGLDTILETASLSYGEQNGTPYINDKTKEIKKKPIEYKKLNVSISESIRLETYMRICITTDRKKQDGENYRISQNNPILNCLTGL